MIKEIKYQGITTNPSDYEAPDGELAAAINLTPEDGAMRPVQPPKDITDGIITDGTIIYTHSVTINGTPQKNLIIYDSEAQVLKYLKLIDGAIDGNATTIQSNLQIQVNDISSIGYIIAIAAADGIHYMRWYAGTYIWLGKNLPEINISLGLNGELHTEEKTTDTGSMSQRNPTFNNVIHGWMNERIVAEHNEGYFVFPFLVRYAYRLYDGTLYKHSAPILMSCTQWATPRAWEKSHDVGSHISTIVLWNIRHRLVYWFYSQDNITEIKKWGDIISSIDIFITAPIWTYDQNRDSGDFPGEYSMVGTFEWGANTRHALRNEFSIFQAQYPNAEHYYHQYSFPKNTLAEDLENAHIFYHLTSIKPYDLSTDEVEIHPDAGTLSTLAQREQMTEDSLTSHDILVPNSLYTYNARLAIADVNRRMFQGFPLLSQLQKGTGASIVEDITHRFVTRVVIEENGENIVVESPISQIQMKAGGVSWQPFYIYLYYTNPNAKEIYIHDLDNGYRLKLALKPHTYLNGAFYAGAIASSYFNQNTPTIPGVTTNNEIAYPEKIYYSAADNPFNFPHALTVGTGRVLALAAATKALSQGQFGQFPLHVFTTEGVWALEVASDGTFSAKSPVTRDVCTNPESITQTDNALLFATDRGIMLLSGSDSKCISDTLTDNGTPFDPEDLPHLSTLCGNIVATDTVPFLQFTQNCRMLYDYTHQRIILYNPDHTYAYVYSLKDNAWGMMPSNIEYHVNAYPDAMAVITETPSPQEEEETVHTLVNFSQTDDQTSGSSTQLLITRPLKLDTPDQLKTIDTIIQRGYFRKGHVQTILYGSRDLFNWHLVYSSTDHYLRGFRGTPYKYFRIALLCTLDKEESVCGCTIQYNPRLTNQPR